LALNQFINAGVLLECERIKENWERERVRKTGNLCVCMNRVRYVTHIIDGDTSATQGLYHDMAVY